EADQVADELARINPRELLYPQSDDDGVPDMVRSGLAAADAIANPRPPWQFRSDEAVEILCRQFDVATLEGFGFDDEDPALRPASAVVHYLLETQKTADGQRRQRLAHLRPPRRFDRAEHLVIDAISLRSLEIERTLRSHETEGSVLATLQGCVTAMGKRRLRQWLCYPLSDRAAIERRQRLVGAMVEDPRLREELAEQLKQVQDVERIGGRLSVGRASPRDLVALGQSSGHVTGLKQLLADRPAAADLHGRIDEVADDLVQLSEDLAEACVDDPPSHMREGGLIRDGYDAELDEQRALQQDSDDWLAEYQKQLIDETGVSSLKVGFNKVYGYYIELTKANRDQAPDRWTRKQTLKNAERFITEKLKQYEEKVLAAEQKQIAREQQLFADLCEQAAQRLPQLHAFAESVSDLDVLRCFAERAVAHGYCRPEIVDTPTLEVAGGRHPVLDEMLGDQFVPNDLNLTTEQDPASLALITGPNMAGKSTFIRQNALIVLLAHTGSFVPADRAVVGLTDRIFTRVGASDELHAGQSTFMVEMTETANLCHHATERSLVILDEIGRGTSTLDGLSLAWAITEHLAGRGCRTLFATHYHELTSLAEQMTAVANLNVSVREWEDEIVFLHRIVPGATDQSYGVHVAKLAGVPEPVIQRAREVLKSIAVSHEGAAPSPAAEVAGANADQPGLFTEYVEHPAMEELREIDIEKLSPLEAFDWLRKVKHEMTDE
ncbi:MAG: DNA mismatch repair protein MutS, partial [Phycisphaeraceae bacterium]|nr:DNA mismatch repair protein MutS [Phycisphaeraceae bacterium]